MRKPVEGVGGFLRLDIDEHNGPQVINQSIKLFTHRLVTIGEPVIYWGPKKTGQNVRLTRNILCERKG